MNKNEMTWEEIVAFVKEETKRIESEPVIVRPEIVKEIMRGAK